MDTLPRRLDDWIKLLSEKRLPCLPLVEDALAKLIEQSDTPPVAELAALIYRDPGLVLEIVQLANGLAPRHLSTKVNSLEQAIMLIGYERTLHLPETMSKLGDLPPANRAGYLRSLMGAYHAACQAWNWARVRHDMVPAEVFTATLLRHVGELAMWVHGGDSMIELARLNEHRAGYHEEAEYVYFGFSLAELSLALVQNLRLPTLAVENVRPEKVLGTRALGITLAARINALAPLGWNHPEFRRAWEAVALYLQEEPAETAERIQAAAEQAFSETSFLEHHPFAPLLEPPPEVPPADTPTTAASPQSRFCITPQRPLYERITQQLRDGDYERLHNELSARHEHVWDWDPIIALGLRAMHGGLGLSRVVFCKYNRATQVLEAYMVRGADSDPYLNRLRLGTAPETLAHELLRTPRALWVNDNTREQLLPRLPRRFRREIGQENFFLGSVFSGHQPFGLIYADRHLAGCRLDPTAFGRFRQLCALISEKLGEADA